LKKTNRVFLVCASIVLLMSGVFCVGRVFAGAEDNVGGWAWSDTIGWVSFNNVAVDGVTGGGGVDYGVSIDADGLMSGYAWSENIGWISFNAADMAGCGGCSGNDCQAEVDKNSYEVSGWAKVLAHGEGWDGCVSLRGQTTGGDDYGVSIDPATGDFHGWAWSDMVLGWLNFNSVDPDAAGGPYKVHTSFSFGPTAKMECDDTSCPYGLCDNNGGATWEAYDQTQECPMCIFSVDNVSTGSFKCSYWELEQTDGPAYYPCTGTGIAGERINLGLFANDIVAGNYELKLTVSDDDANANCTAGNSDTVTHAITIKQGIDADFECALGDPVYNEETNPDPAPWQDCTSDSDEFAKRIVKGGVIYVKDISTPSAGAGVITDYNWKFTIDEGTANEQIVTSNDSIASFTAGKNNKIELKVFDNYPRTNCKDVIFGARSLPKWEEVPI